MSTFCFAGFGGRMHVNQPKESFPDPTSWVDVQHVKWFLFLFVFCRLPYNLALSHITKYFRLENNAANNFHSLLFLTYCFFSLHSRQDPSLWSQALSYFARKEEDCKKHIMEVLDRIFFCNE